MRTRASAAVAVLAAMCLTLAPAVGADIGSTGWLRVVANGFGDVNNSMITSFGVFNDHLYAGTSNLASGAEIWIRSDGGQWSPVRKGGFNSAHNNLIFAFATFNSALYAAAENGADGAEIWRTSNGWDWSQVVSKGFGDGSMGYICHFAYFGAQLYASTFSFVVGRGGEVWRSGTGNAGDWSCTVSNGFGDAHNSGVVTLEDYQGCLYGGTANSFQTPSGWASTGGEVWRSSNGSGWSQVNADGFGDVNNTAICSLAEFGRRLYASTLGTRGHGTEVWRCQTCNGSDWTQVVDNGFGNATNNGFSSLEVVGSQLYCAVGNATMGMEVWRSGDGSRWEQVASAGFGDAKNLSFLWDSSLVAFREQLYVGTARPYLQGGGEVWTYLPRRVYPPALVRQP